MTYLINGHLISKSSSSYGNWYIKPTETTFQHFWTLKAAKAWAAANPA